MSGMEHGSTKKNDFLDRCYGDQRKSVLIVVAVAAGVYLLSLLLSDITDIDVTVRPLVMGFGAFAAVYLVFGFQLKNPLCSGDAMDKGLWFFTVFGIGGIALWLALFGVWLLFTGRSSDTATMVAEGAGVWCGLCVIHNKRK